MLIRQGKIVSIHRVADRWRHLLAMCGLGAGLMLAPAMTAEAAWTVAIKPDPVTRQPRCLLSSEAQVTPTGHENDTTPVSLVINSSSLLVMTESDLDSSFNDLQLVVDDKPPVQSRNIFHNTNLVFDQNVQDLMQLMRTGRQVTVYLRFWPTWPVTQTFPVRFSLGGFSRAHDSLNQNCQPVIAPVPAPPPPPPSRPAATPAPPSRPAR